ncbi:MAG: biotin--[acetyl-CoA-carboxylase] ligase [Pirellulales bacterium]|nr:biotin--[acetyl-CoA-carboxylase] ligase [Pirellulales bacterium]
MEADDTFVLPGDWGKAGPDLEHLIASTPLGGAEFHAVIPSSQARAKEVHAQACELPYLVLADSIPGAHGRHGRAWWTGAGILSFTLLWRPRTSTDNASADRVSAGTTPTGIVSLAAGIAVIDSVVAVTGGELTAGREITLHWPNDVYLHGRKLSGILLEQLSGGVLAIGIGLNVNNRAAQAPDELKSLMTSVADEIGHDLGREVLLVDLLRRFFTLAKLATNASGRMQVVRRANELCIQIGRQTNIQVGQSVFSGPCVAIDATGSLVIETNQGHRAFPSGEITTTEIP